MAQGMRPNNLTRLLDPVQATFADSKYDPSCGLNDYTAQFIPWGESLHLLLSKEERIEEDSWVDHAYFFAQIVCFALSSLPRLIFQLPAWLADWIHTSLQKTVFGGQIDSQAGLLSYFRSLGHGFLALFRPNQMRGLVDVQGKMGWHLLWAVFIATPALIVMLLSIPLLYTFSVLDQIARLTTPLLYVVLTLLINLPFNIIQTCAFIWDYPLYTLESLVLGACAVGLAFTLFGFSPILFAIAGTIGFLSGLGMHHPKISAFFVTRHGNEKINLVGKGLARWGLILLAALLLTPGVIIVSGLPAAAALGISIGIPALAGVSMALVAQAAITAAAALTCVLIVTFLLPKLVQWTFFPKEKTDHALMEEYMRSGSHSDQISSDDWIELDDLTNNHPQHDADSHALRSEELTKTQTKVIPIGAFNPFNGDTPENISDRDHEVAKKTQEQEGETLGKDFL